MLSHVRVSAVKIVQACRYLSGFPISTPSLFQYQLHLTNRQHNNYNRRKLLCSFHDFNKLFHSHFTIIPLSYNLLNTHYLQTNLRCEDIMLILTKLKKGRFNKNNEKKPASINPLRTVLIYVPVFLQSGQLCGSPCRTQVLVIRDFATTCTCQHYYAIFMHSACTHVCTIHVTCVLVGIRLYTSTGPVSSLKLLL